MSVYDITGFLRTAYRPLAYCVPSKHPLNTAYKKGGCHPQLQVIRHFTVQYQNIFGRVHSLKSNIARPIWLFKLCTRSNIFRYCTIICLITFCIIYLLFTLEQHHHLKICSFLVRFIQIGRERENRQIHNAHQCFISPALVSTASNLH